MSACTFQGFVLMLLVHSVCATYKARSSTELKADRKMSIDTYGDTTHCLHRDSEIKKLEGTV